MATDAELKALVIEAIFKSLGEQKRDELIKNALTSLLEPEPRGSGYSYDSRSKLERAYADAVSEIARAEVSRVLKEDKKIRDIINTLILKSFDKVLSDGLAHDQLVSNLAAGISNAFRIKD